LPEIRRNKFEGDEHDAENYGGGNDYFARAEAVCETADERRADGEHYICEREGKRNCGASGMKFGGERFDEDAEAVDENWSEAEEESEGGGEDYVPAEEEFFGRGGHFIVGQ
jgi:hypothetical protein